MKKTHLVISSVLIFAIASSAPALPVNAVNKIAEEKIDVGLKRILEASKNDESFDVSVWLDDIDHEYETKKITETFKEKVDNDELPEEIFEMFGLNQNNEAKPLDSTRIKKIDAVVSTEKMQLALMTKRQISSEMYKETNAKNAEIVFF